MLDVGYAPGGSTSAEGNFYDHRQRADTFDQTIGARYQGLANLLTRRTVPVKLTAPYAEYVTRDAHALGPVEESGFTAVQSFARGGLANAWGAGLYRFVDVDLHGFPITVSDIDPYFDTLTETIGIAGAEDDLAPDFGPATGLTEPLTLSRNISSLYNAYQRRGETREIRLGRARVAALTRAQDDRPRYQYNAHEFFEEDRSLYSPRYTVDRLVAESKLEVHDGLLVESWEEGVAGVRVFARDIASGEVHEFRCRRLFLAAGAINTTRIVLRTATDYEAKLPLLENPALQFPLVMPRFLGSRLETDAFGLVQLNLVWDSPGYGMRLQGSIMEITAPSRAEFFSGFPYSARSNLSLIRQMLPGMIVMQLFFPGYAQPPARVSLCPDGTLRIDGHQNKLGLSRLSPLLGFMRRLGAFTSRRLVVRVPTGHAVHYASTLPMKREPDRYECYPDGRLFGTRNVYVVDSAGFTRLPAKNMSFAMMANAMRIVAGARGGDAT